MKYNGIFNNMCPHLSWVEILCRGPMLIVIDQMLVKKLLLSLINMIQIIFYLLLIHDFLILSN